jgi:hypothetical protein
MHERYASTAKYRSEFNVLHVDIVWEYDVTCQYVSVQTDFYCIIKNAKNNIREYAFKPETAKIVTNEQCYFYSIRFWNNTHVEATVINVSL